jgi:hypothetical protein
MGVKRRISSTSMLLWSGAKCCTSTKAMPGAVSLAMPEKNASKAANPPAEAPMPTMGKVADVMSGGLVGLLAADDLALARGPAPFVGVDGSEPWLAFFFVMGTHPVVTVAVVSLSAPHEV